MGESDELPAAAAGEAPVEGAPRAQTAPTKEKKKKSSTHWTEQELGVEFDYVVKFEEKFHKKLGAESITVKLWCNPNTGFAESVDKLWKWAPTEAVNDSAQKIRQNIQSANGVMIRRAVGRAVGRSV